MVSQRKSARSDSSRSVPENSRIWLNVTCAFFSVCLVGQSAAAGDVRFNRDIRPILSQGCFQCHGPDEAHREAELRLDEESGIRSAFGGGLNESEAWQRITSNDPDLVMPPPDSNLDISPAEMKRIEEWVKAGAEWEGHWSFLRPVQPELPQVENTSQIRNPIDAFVLARLETEGRQLSKEADRRRLIRRVYLDLTGLPPTPEAVDAFLADKSEQAYEKVVDKLLDDPHFGERMALVWMDAARYGDSSVFHADGPRDMWAWRDWVIRSYNQNKPFDVFTVEQLAGDLLPDASMDQRLATGFLRNNATTDEGGAIAEEYRVEYAIDRVKTTSMVWLGLSLECAQCHNHKYDPITQEEYYEFFAYFNQASDPGMQTRRGNQTPIVEVFSPEQQQRASDLEMSVAAFESKLEERRSASRPDFEAWLKKGAGEGEQPAYPHAALIHLPFDAQRLANLGSKEIPKKQLKFNGQPGWTIGKFGGAFSSNNKTFLDVGNVADFERDQAFSYGAWIRPKGAARGAILSRMNNNKAFRGYDLLCSDGFVEVHIVNTWPNNAIKVRTEEKLQNDKWQHVFVTYDGSSKAAGLRIFFNGVEKKWKIEQDGLTETIRNKVSLRIGRRNPDSPFNGPIDDARIYDRELTAGEVDALFKLHPVEAVRTIPAEERTDDQVAQLQTYYLEEFDDLYKALRKKLESDRTALEEARKPFTTAMVMQDVPKMRETFVLDRGNYSSPKKDSPQSPGVPQVLPDLPTDAPANRLGLAQWLVRSDHPLTARVTVNRYWHMLFGEGLVRTVEDFGVQGEWPSHPALLDWLAVDFMDHGWDIKRTLKQMVMSATYRQSARVDAEMLELDPENRLLTRGPRFRLAGELVRDQALAVSGLLVRDIGGPSVKPYQPPGLWNEVSLSGNVRFAADKGEKLYRRSLYTYWKRSSPAPAMTLFDAPTREKCVLRRSRTNTPLQALVLMNDPQFVEAARVLAERAMKDGGKTPEEQIRFAYQQSMGFAPSDRTLELLTSTFREELDVFRSSKDRATQLLSVGESSRDESLDAAHHAALTIVTTTILNLDEFVTRG